MTLGFGPDFQLAKSTWGYKPDGAPSALAAIGCAVGLILILFVLQNLAGLAVFFALFDQQAIALQGEAAAQSALAKAALVGLFPAGLIAIIASWYLTRHVGKEKPYGLPMHVPNLGIAGWATVVFGFCALVMAIYYGAFTAAGIDPATYAPTADGLDDNASSAGMVEKALADLANEPFLFALAVPGVALAVPVAEELIFRGPLFATLTQTQVGRWGAVVITSALWAVMHMTAPWMFVVIIFMMGLVLGALLLRFGSVLVTIVCHCIWNSYSALAIFSGLATQ
jgi:uncharacterized protein